MSTHVVSPKMMQSISDKIKYIQHLEYRQIHRLPIPSPCLREQGVWLALHSADWRHLPQSLVEEQLSGVSGILALDDCVALMAEQCGVPTLLPEDILSRVQIAGVLAQAAAYAETWYTPLEKLLSVDGVFWPKLDHGCLRFFWEDSFLGQAVACAMAQTNRKLAVVVSEPYAPPLHYRTGDTFARAASTACEDVTVLRLSKERGEPSALGVPLMSETFSLFSLKNLEGATVIAALPSQLRAVANALGNKADRQSSTFFLSLGITQINTLHGIPVLSLPAPRYSAEDAPFAAALQQLRTLVHPESPAVGTLATQCLEAFLRLRWPWLVRWRQRIATVLKTFPPACLICTDVYDAENKLTAMTAKELGIPVLTMGTGNLVPCGQLRPEHTNALWINNIASYQCAMRAGFSASAIIPAEQRATAPTEGDVWPPRERPGECRVLVLLPLPRTGSGAGMENHMRAVQQWVKTVTSLKDTLSLRLLFLPHPCAISTYLQDQVEIAEEEKLSPQCPVDGYLRACDICLSMEEHGERFLAASMQVPTLLAVDEGQFLRPSLYTSILQKYPNLCTDTINLTQTLKRLVHNGEALRKAEAAQKKVFSGQLNGGLRWYQAACKLMQTSRI